MEYETALSKLKELFGIETLMLGGGGGLNWSFIQAGMCNEVSVVIAACGHLIHKQLFLVIFTNSIETEKPYKVRILTSDKIHMT